MDWSLEYHNGVKRWLSAPVAVFGVLLLLVFSLPASQAQINGTPASVTSSGFGGHSSSGTPASVTSLGPHGYAPNNGVQFHGNVSTQSHTGENRDHHHNLRGGYGGEVYGVPVGVPVPYAEDAAGDAEGDDSAEYQGGPTIFDRRGAGAQSYVPPVANPPDAHPSQSVAADPPETAAAPDPTLLVFRDGRQLEVGNYAIVGRTLYDMTPGHPRKVAVADLDLDATEKQNESRGVIFQLPPSALAN
ncbi:MAG TPA: hypothetical protein VI386_00865 [Candidatus Sulfotelmatobacter sp.]